MPTSNSKSTVTHSPNMMREPMITSSDAASDHDGLITDGGKNELSTLMGVYIPCMLSILGAILFLRLSWAVGQTGYFGVVGIFALAGLAVFLTALSISAISTNGSMGGGGAYFMISRSIGPEFGGAVGVIFYFANAFATTFYLVAFADNIVKTFELSSNVWLKIAVASIALLCTLAAGLIGADFFSKLNAGILVCIIVAITMAFISLIFGDSLGCTQNHPNGTPGFTGPLGSTFSTNVDSNYTFVVNDATGIISTTEKYDFFQIFGIVFPAMTGIMAGANLSGDLADPGRSIGKGTLSAIGSSLVIYLALGLVAASSVESHALVSDTQLLQTISCWTSGKYWIVLGIVCSTLSSALGALTGAARVLQAFCLDFSVMGDSEANVSFAVRMLKIFAWGTAGKNEPRYGILLTWAIAQALLLLGSLDLIASIITNCFLLTYFFTNFACFILTITGAPNFRPRFKFFTWHTALLGAILNLVIMFLASPVFAAVSIFIMLIVFAIIVYTAPDVPWGDVSQALIYHQVRKYLLRLDERKSHPKFWRPSILLMIDNPLVSMPLIDFCNSLKKGGLYVVGDVCVGGDLQETGSTVMRLQELWNDFMPLTEIKAFPECILAENYRKGRQTLMLSAGMGGMRPNTVVLPFLEEQQEEAHDILVEKKTDDLLKAFGKLEEISRIHSKTAQDSENLKHNRRDSLHDFVGSIQDALFLNKNLLVVRNFHKLSKAKMVSDVLGLHLKANGQISNKMDGSKLKKTSKKDREKVFIDIWITEELDEEDLHSYSGALSLMLQLAHGLNRTSIWNECATIRLVHVVNGESDENALKAHKERVEEIIHDARVVAEVDIKVLPPLSKGQSSSAAINEIIAKNSSMTAMLFLNMPLLVEHKEASENLQQNCTYMTQLQELTNNLPPCVLTAAGQRLRVISTEI